MRLARDAAAALALALIQGGLVALPRPGALAPLGRLRSPVWAAILPGSILLGTFGPLTTHASALWLVLLAAIAAGPLACLAALAVVRGVRGWMPALLVTVAVIAAVAGGGASQLPATVITALACMALGAALARVIPVPWMFIGVLTMAIADLALLVTGAGQPAAALIAAATPHSAVFDSVHIGHLTLDYPDLVLAATLGAFLANQRGQHRGAVLVATLSACCFMLTPRGGIWPATLPVALTLLALSTAHLRQLIGRSKPWHRIARAARGVKARPHGRTAGKRAPSGASYKPRPPGRLPQWEQ